MSAKLEKRIPSGGSKLPSRIPGAKLTKTAAKVEENGNDVTLNVRNKKHVTVTGTEKQQIEKKVDNNNMVVDDLDTFAMPYQRHGFNLTDLVAADIINANASDAGVMELDNMRRNEPNNNNNNSVISDCTYGIADNAIRLLPAIPLKRVKDDEVLTMCQFDDETSDIIMSYTNNSHDISNLSSFPKTVDFPRFSDSNCSSKKIAESRVKTVAFAKLKQNSIDQSLETSSFNDCADAMLKCTEKKLFADHLPVSDAYMSTRTDRYYNSSDKQCRDTAAPCVRLEWPASRDDQSSCQREHKIDRPLSGGCIADNLGFISEFLSQTKASVEVTSSRPVCYQLPSFKPNLNLRNGNITALSSISSIFCACECDASAVVVLSMPTPSDSGIENYLSETCKPEEEYTGNTSGTWSTLNTSSYESSAVVSCCNFPPRMLEDSTLKLDRKISMLEDVDDGICMKTVDSLDCEDNVTSPIYTGKAGHYVSTLNSKFRKADTNVCRKPSLTGCEHIAPIHLSQSEAVLVPHKNNSVCKAAEKCWHSTDSCETVNSLNSVRSCASLPQALLTKTVPQALLTKTNDLKQHSSSLLPPRSVDTDKRPSPELSCFRPRANSPDEGDCKRPRKLEKSASVSGWAHSKLLQRIFSHPPGSVERRNFKVRWHSEIRNTSDSLSKDIVNNNRYEEEPELVININRYRSLSQRGRLPYYVYYGGNTLSTPPMAVFMSNEDISKDIFPLRHASSEPVTSCAQNVSQSGVMDESSSSPTVLRSRCSERRPKAQRPNSDSITTQLGYQVQRRLNSSSPKSGPTSNLGRISEIMVDVMVAIFWLTD